MAVVAGPRAVVAARVAGKGVLLLQDLRPSLSAALQFIPDFLHLVFRGRYWKLSLFGQTLPKGAASEHHDAAAAAGDDYGLGDTQTCT